jgi:hypothetical protein
LAVFCGYFRLVFLGLRFMIILDINANSKVCLWNQI